MNKHFIKQYAKATKKILSSETRAINQAVDSINKSQKIKENVKNLQAKFVDK